MIFMENGVPLKPHSQHYNIREGEKGLFSHWGSRILFSSFNEGNPFNNTYSLVIPDLEYKIIGRATGLWIVVIVLCVLAAFIIRFKYGNKYPKRYSILFLFALFVSYYFLTVLVDSQMKPIGRSGWNYLYVYADSGSYMQKYSFKSLRPPLYPLFIQLVTIGTGFDHDYSNYSISVPITDKDDSDPLMKVVRAQKVFLLLSSMIACYSLMLFMGPVLPPMLFLWLYDYNFFTQQLSGILSETLTQCWLFLVIAVFILFLKKKWKFCLPLVGVSCAMLYLTRPAAAYGIVILAATILWALWSNWRKYWRWSLIALVLSGGLALTPSFVIFFRTGHFTISNYAYIGKSGFAIEVAEPEDVSIMPDENSKQFLIKALNKKKELDEEIKSMYPEGYYYWMNICPSNVYYVALPTASEVLTGSPLEVRHFINMISDRLLKKHRSKHFKIAWESFHYAITRITRLTFPKFNFWAIMALSLILIIVLRGWIGICSATLILVHLMHIIIVAFIDLPIVRYIYQTELLVIIGVFILIWAFFNKFVYPILIKTLRNLSVSFNINMGKPDSGNNIQE